MAKGRGLEYKARLDVAEAIKNAQAFRKELNAMGIGTSGKAFDPKPISNYQQALLKSQEVLRDARLETERLKQEQQAARVEMEKGRVAQQEARTATENLKTSEQKLAVQLQQGRISQQQYNQQLAQGKIAMQQQSAALNQGKIDAQSARTQLAQLTLQQRLLAQQTRDARAAQRAATGSYDEATARLKQLGQQIRSVSGGFAATGPIQQARIKEYAQLNKQLTEFDRRLGNNQRNVGNYQGALKGVGGSLVSLASGYVSAYAAIAGVSKIVQNNSEISDSLADVRRTAGLTEAEADKLLETFKQFDTRTSLKGLIDIATIGGQLGIAKDDVAGFTRSIDQLAVVLSGEIPGGAEEVATALGKINGVFRTQQQEGTTVEESFNRTGSAILKLGQDGLATGEFLVDFTQRISGSSKAANIALPTMLAYGSILEEAGKSAEVAGTSVNRLLAGLSNKRQQYFAIAKLGDSSLTIKEFTRLINTDTASALNLFFKGLNSGNPSQTAFNDRLKSIPRLAGEARNTIIALAQNQEELANKIKLSTTAYEDADAITEQIGIKNDTLAGSVDRLNKIFESATTSGAISRFFKSIVDGLADGLNSFNKFVNSSSWQEFKHRLLDRDGGDSFMLGDSFRKLSERVNANQGAIYKQGETLEQQAARFQSYGAQSLQKSLDNVKKTADAAKAALKEYEDGVKSGKLVESGSTVADYKETYNKAKTQYDDLLALQKQFGYNKKKEDTKQNDESGLTTSPSASEANKYQSAVKARNTMQREIDALTKKGTDKQLSADDQELESVRAKYKKMRDAAIAFNNDPRNKAKGLRVNSSGLLDAQSKEEDAVRDKTASENLKKSLDKQQDLYAAFEEAKTKIGKDKAAKRYEGQIDTDRTYLQKLEEQRDALLNPQKSKGGEEVDTVANQLQLKVLNEAIEKEKLVQQKKYDDLLASLVTFEKEVTKTKEDYATARATLEANGDEAGLAQLTKNYNKRLAELGDSHLQEMDAFKKLYAGIDNLSDENARKMLGNAEDALKSLKTKGVVISKELEVELAKLFGNTRIAIAERLPEKIIALANQIDNVARSVSDVNEEFGKVLSTLGNVVGQVGNIKKGINDLKDFKDKKDGFGSLTAGLGIFGAGISVISSVVKMFDRSAQREEQAAYARDLQNKQTEALNKSLERQIALLNDAYGTDRINKYSEAIKKAQENEKKYQEQLTNRVQLTGNKKLDEQISKFNNGEKLDGIYGKLFTDLYKQGALESLPSDLEALQDLAANGKLDAATAAIVDNLLKAKEAAKDLTNNLNSDNVGSSLDEITDSFITTLTDGTQAFGKSFEEVIRKSIINGFKQKLIEEQLQPFYSQFAELSKGGLTKDEIAALQKSYTKAAEDAKKNIKDLETATGIDLTNPADKPTGIQGTITSAGLTEDSANRAMGIWQGQYDQTKKIAMISADCYKIATNHLAVSQQIAANTLRGANNTDGIGAKLDQIVANTSSSGAMSLDQQLRNEGVA